MDRHGGHSAGGFDTPGLLVGEGTRGKSLLSERREELWRGNFGELSPDSRELFNDIEEAENATNTWGSGGDPLGGRALGEKRQDVGFIGAGCDTRHEVDVSKCARVIDGDHLSNGTGAQGCVFSHGSSKKALNFDTPASAASVGTSGLLDSHASHHSLHQRAAYATPSSALSSEREGSAHAGGAGMAGVTLSFSAHSSAHPSVHPSAASATNLLPRGVTHGQRLSFSSMSRSMTMSASSILSESLASSNQEDEEEESLVYSAWEPRQLGSTPPPLTPDDITMGGVMDRSVQLLHSAADAEDEDDMDESERLARQLMAEEEAQLLERMHKMQQEEFRRMNEAAVTVHSDRTANSVSSPDSRSAADVAFAMRLLEEEEEQAILSEAEAERLADSVGVDGEINPDAMSYEQLLEIGERLGDVAKERWRIDGCEIVASLETLVFNEETKQSDKLANVGVFKCLVCQYDYEKQEQLKLLPCGHAFHQECIDPWLTDHDTCVTCKRSIKSEGREDTTATD